ncbi:ATP-binding protein [Flavobacterium sp.]|uniref:ATP-binding protein n=1 Tax=Flavobacterium sp. TaxID=239 RepID=UPI002B4AF01D|nr:ATP-binding protein [Flavobacterium sp.]HLF51812.1 ATP-binding protein [Flavobacterium sp.]
MKLGLYKNSQIFKIALGIAIVIIGYIASVFYSQMQKLDSHVELISNSNETQIELEKILSKISSYETNLRAYIITKNESYIENRFLDRGEIELNLQKIKKLAANNPARIKDIDSLKKMVDYRFILFRKTLTIAKSKDVNEKELNEILTTSSDLTEKMKIFVYKRINAENSFVKFNNNSHQFELRDSMISAFLLVILSLLILWLSFNKMNVDIEELKKANDELKLLNHSYNSAEMTAGFGHWKLNLKTNKYLFSDNLYRLMGVEPHAFEPSLENALKYFHPDDLDYVMEVHKKSLEDHMATSLVYRVLTPDNKIKYIRSDASFTKNGKGELVKVGVNYDISEQYKKTRELEENNNELKSINAELESFNNIVSHDLQEPLRKIQMFISRLEEKEINLLSQQGKDYFSKIHLTANRMQALLIDLLNYSRTIKGDKIFVKTDLNEILQQILQDLAPTIEEKNADIYIEDLPILNAIPFQMVQLFTNLISNSLKYSKEDAIPKISIYSEKIGENEIFEGKLIVEQHYYKIIIKDNGIGFKQEYAEKIFLLFKRLETDSKYSGTGLGLAICKKIMDNHNGFIKVEAEPNEGAKFSVFIPKAN